MELIKRKKVLLILGMDCEKERLLQQTFNTESADLLILNSFGPEITQPFGELMRGIITAVYQEKVEEIFIVGTNKKLENERPVFDKLIEKRETEEKIKTLDYQFKYYMRIHSSSNVKEWIEGSKTVTEAVQGSVNLIQNHPFLPAYVKVQGLIVNEDESIINISL